jgi:hypothetical protein
MIETSGAGRVQRRIQRRIEFVGWLLLLLLLLLIVVTAHGATAARHASADTDELIIASTPGNSLPIRPEFTC